VVASEYVPAGEKRDPAEAATVVAELAVKRRDSAEEATKLRGDNT
jgi:hypothetical protein